jgi:apolipoprotein N-acyltransferase
MAARTLRDDEALPTAGPQPVGAGAHPIALALASALLLWLAFPPTGWTWLAWVALVPLFLLVRSNRSPAAIYFGSWLGGMVFWHAAIHWVRLTEPDTAWLAWIVMATVLSLWWPVWLLLTRIGVRRMGLPMMLVAPVAWVALEHLRAFIVSGFPWYYLAHTHYQALPFIQIADITGALGVSFLIAMANACGAELLSAPLWEGSKLARPQVVRVSVLAAAVAMTLGYGFWRQSSAHFRPGPRIALVQSNIKQVYKQSLSADKIVETYRRLIEPSTHAAERPDLLIWPETSYPYGYVQLDPLLDSEAFLRQIRGFHPSGTADFWLQKMRNISASLHVWTDQLQIPMLIGTLTYDFRREGFSKYNSAVLFVPGSPTVQAYYKLHLVPFGEYVPFIETMPWLRALTPYRDDEPIPSLTFGSGPRWFRLNDYRFATAICFEDSVSRVVRRFFAEAPDGHQPDVLLNMSNDGWFQWSEELEMHLATSVFRAVENRVPLARAVNTGISAFVDGNGRILAAKQKNTEGLLTAVVPLDDRIGLYSSWGDWLGALCLGLAGAIVPLGLLHVAYRRHQTKQELSAVGSLPEGR